MSDQFNAAQFLLHRHIDEGRGGNVAVKRGAARLSYADLSLLVRQVGAAFRALRLRRDDRVLMFASDEVATLASILAAFHSGLVAVPVSTMLNGAELGKIVADSGARIVVCAGEFAALVSEALEAATAVEFVVQIGEPGSISASDRYFVYDWDTFVALGAARFMADDSNGAVEPTIGDSWALWLYTSGTTGRPKAAVHRHANIRSVCKAYGQQVLGIVPDDATFSVAKLFFAYGIGNSLFFPFSVGATTVLEPGRPSPQLAAERLLHDRPTLFFAVPTFYAALVVSDIPDDAFASVRWCVSAGEPLPAPLQKRFTERFGTEILDGLGSTEALHIFLSNRPGDIRPGTTGRPVPGYDVEIRDRNGAVAEVGQPGVVYVRGDSMALGYWNQTEASRQVFRGPWLRTGDIFVRDEEGYFSWLGRDTDMIKAGGIWVSPAEVESRLLEHPAVSDVAVVGLADAAGIEKPVAFVVSDEVTSDELIAWCRAGLAHFKAPRQVVFVNELPRTATGKLQRFRVRATPVEPDSAVAAADIGGAAQ